MGSLRSGMKFLPKRRTTINLVVRTSDGHSAEIILPLRTPGSFTADLRPSTCSGRISPEGQKQKIFTPMNPSEVPLRAKLPPLLFADFECYLCSDSRKRGTDQKIALAGAFPKSRSPVPIRSLPLAKSIRRNHQQTRRPQPVRPLFLAQHCLQAL